MKKFLAVLLILVVFPLKSQVKWYTLSEALKAQKTQPKKIFIDFYADWCGPCRIASPILEEVSQEYAGKIDVYKIDTQKEQELAADFGISSIPAFLYIPKNGKPVMAAGIGRSKEETKNMFKENISKILLITN